MGKSSAAYLVLLKTDGSPTGMVCGMKPHVSNMQPYACDGVKKLNCISLYRKRGIQRAIIDSKRCLNNEINKMHKFLSWYKRKWVVEMRLIGFPSSLASLELLKRFSDESESPEQLQRLRRWSCLTCQFDF